MVFRKKRQEKCCSLGRVDRGVLVRPNQQMEKNTYGPLTPRSSWVVSIPWVSRRGRRKSPLGGWIRTTRGGGQRNDDFGDEPEEEEPLSMQSIQSRATLIDDKNVLDTLLKFLLPVTKVVLQSRNEDNERARLAFEVRKNRNCVVGAQNNKTKTSSLFSNQNFAIIVKSTPIIFCE